MPNIALVVRSGIREVIWKGSTYEQLPLTGITLGWWANSSYQGSLLRLGAGNHKDFRESSLKFTLPLLFLETSRRQSLPKTFWNHTPLVSCELEELLVNLNLRLEMCGDEWQVVEIQPITD